MGMVAMVLLVLLVLPFPPVNSFSGGMSGFSFTRTASALQAKVKASPPRAVAASHGKSKAKPYAVVSAPPGSIVKVGGGRQIVPGDYVVHETYGIGRYAELRRVDLTPTRGVRTYEALVVVEYADTEVSWYKRVAEKELWLYRSADSGVQELSSVMDSRKWTRHKDSVNKQTKKGAMNLMRVMAVRNSYHRLPCARDGDEYGAFERSFAFSATADQEECFENVRKDMTDMTRPMDRLICGDVGFGKTEVAMRAIYRAVLAKRQVAFLAPTRVLALQHLRVLRKRFPKGVHISLLRGGKGPDKDKLKAAMKSGEAQVVVGTHALLQPDIAFKNLGLLVVDEEQRFGVGHKEKLKLTQSGIDVLTLSATPIPRTLQISLSGLRDLSLMNSPPAGRKEVQVKVGDDSDAIIAKAIVAERKRGGQVFVVVPFVRDVAPTRNRILRIVPGLRVIEAHGRHTDLEDRIDQFSTQAADVLVATTIIENGIDMPNVNTIIVLQADRFGISALYQLRGRVGRCDRQAFAFFLRATDKVVTLEAETRLAYIQTITALGSGYDLSRRDMEMRGYGTIFGAEQSGSKDVGIDLQTEILRGALDELQEKIFMPVQVARVDLGTDLELLATALVGPMPEQTDVEALLRWESRLAAVVLKRAFPSSADDVLRELRAFNGASGPDDVAALLKRWMAAMPTAADDPEVPVGPQLFELAKRKLLSMHCRQLGVTDIYKDAEGRIVLSFDSYLTHEKWSAACTAGSVVLGATLSHHADGYLQTKQQFEETRSIPHALLDTVTQLELRARAMMKNILVDDSDADLDEVVAEVDGA